MATQKIYLFNGYNDDVVARPVADSLRTYYAHYLGPNVGNLFSELRRCRIEAGLAISVQSTSIVCPRRRVVLACRIETDVAPGAALRRPGQLRGALSAWRPAY
jgi:hypothetical protein